MRRLLLPLVLCASCLTATAGLSRPLILVPGWGPERVTRMTDLRAYFELHGYAAADLHELSYPYQGTMEEIYLALLSQMKQVAKSYPPGTQFDIITHSEGHFLALYTLLKSGFSRSVDHYVGLAGVAYGQDKRPYLCNLIQCGETMNYLVPYKNAFLLSFYADHLKALAKLRKCSLYSNQDHMVKRPHNAGSFADGLNIEVPNTSHLQFIHDPNVFEIVLDRCLAD